MVGFIIVPDPDLIGHSTKGVFMEMISIMLIENKLIFNPKENS